MKKAFTLIEILIVVIILAIFIGAIGFFMPDNVDKKIKFGKECSNYIYQEILNELNSIEKSKIINSGGLVYIHTLSNIRKDGYSSNLKIESNYGNNILDRDVIDGSGICLSEYISNKNNYFMKTNNNFGIRIEKNNVFVQNNEGVLNVCDKDGSNCFEISQIEYNQAVGKFEQKICSVFSGGNCIEWE